MTFTLGFLCGVAVTLAIVFICARLWREEFGEDE